MIHTYRKWKDWETFYIESYDEEDNDYYCVAPYYEDSWHFDSEYILEESGEANLFDIIKYKYECLIYKL